MIVHRTPHLVEIPNGDASERARQAERNRFVAHLTRIIGHDFDLESVAGAYPWIDSTANNWPEELAKAIAVRVQASLPRTSEASRLVGPFYRASDLVTWKSITRQAISKQTRERRLLSLVTESGTLVYPAWQFGLKGEPLPHLAEVLNLIDPTDSDPLSSALWLNRSAERFGGLTPADALRAGRTADVLRAARQIASANAA